MYLMSYESLKYPLQDWADFGTMVAWLQVCLGVQLVRAFDELAEVEERDLIC